MATPIGNFSRTSAPSTLPFHRCTVRDGRRNVTTAFEAQLAEKILSSNEPTAREELRQIAGVSQRTLEQVRETAHGRYRGGLFEEVAASPHVEAATETTLSLVLREAITNVVRHADARRCVSAGACSTSASTTRPL